MELVKLLILKGVDLVLPPRCIQTGEIVAKQGALSPKAWQALNFITDPACRMCGYPFDFKTEADNVCAACLAEPPPFTSARSAVAYDEASRDMILKFKHGDHLHAVATLAPMMSRAGHSQITAADVIVPVPLHRWRLLRRRYNQAGLLAQRLAAVHGLRCLPDGLVRTRATPSQGHLRAKAREDNVRGAFRVNIRRAENIAGKSILLIDDVYTTGSTLKACAKALMAGGASGVHVLTIARVIKPGQFN